ncbi:hypothetical protein E2C01_030988 [Portunus trituberculatus]|uniref:Uncharacterized protein n=1 Tax=Portunus trituberculatus TaxID=210409 RepID=A0A5B7EWV9_PORTR|nr:hypothetical protein [Portunus trituberculatus]
MKKKLREVSRHFGSPPREQSDLKAFLVPFSEWNSEVRFGVAILNFFLSEGRRVVFRGQSVTVPLSCETQRETFSEIRTSFNGKFTIPPLN